MQVKIAVAAVLCVSVTFGLIVPDGGKGGGSGTLPLPVMAHPGSGTCLLPLPPVSQTF